MYNRFRQFNTRWLKENGTSHECIDEMLLGEHLEPHVKTICVKESYLKKTPYHVYYRYKVIDDSNKHETKQKSSSEAEAKEEPAESAAVAIDLKIESNSEPI
jgi:hypothetical protein